VIHNLRGLLPLYSNDSRDLNLWYSEQPCWVAFTDSYCKHLLLAGQIGQMREVREQMDPLGFQTKHREVFASFFEIIFLFYSHKNVLNTI